MGDLITGRGHPTPPDIVVCPLSLRGAQICTTVENGYYLIGDITGAQYNEDDISLISRLILSVVTNITELVSEAQPQQ